MILEKSTFPRDTLSEFTKKYLTEDMLLFDIETTGLSPEQNSIYCIGCGYLSGDEICVELFFAERPEEEAEVLSSFFTLVQKHNVLLTFNGSTFDLPFLEKRAEAQKYAPALSEAAVRTVCERFPASYAHVDLYREVTRMRHLLDLSSYRQKNIEQFLGCDREDKYTGGELTRIYREYVRHPDPEAREVILLHNREDVAGMFRLLSILSYRQFPDGRFEIEDIMEENSDDNRWLCIRLHPDCPLPQSIHKILPDAAFALDREMSLIRLPLFHGELKHFFDDPENYYYLPAEDEAVHKSVGRFVDSSHRIRATKKTCYIKKECDYLTFPISSDCSELKKDFTDKNTYLEIPARTEDLKHLLSLYFSHVF